MLSVQSHFQKSCCSQYGIGSRQKVSVKCYASAFGGFRPCIDIHDGKVKQIVGGTLKDSTTSSNSIGDSEAIENFVSEQPSSWYAELYKKDDVKGGHIIMLGATQANKKVSKEALKVWPGGFQLGGGVNEENAIEYLDAGASHVIVTSYVFNAGKLNEDRLKNLVKLVGKNRLVLDLSCRQRDGSYWVVTDRWQKFTQFKVDRQSLSYLGDYCDEFLVHGVDVEGLKLGVDAKLVELLGKYCDIPVTYAGGVATMEDLDLVQNAGNGVVGVTVGSALDIFGGELAYTDVISWHQQLKQQQLQKQ